MNTAATIATIVERFGLQREMDLAALLDIRSAHAISNWKRLGHIPWRRQIQLQQLARERGVDLPPLNAA